MNDSKIQGGCQCGSVRYLLSKPPEMVYTCHCTICRLISTSIFNVSCIIEEGSITIEQGELARTEWTAGNDIKRFGDFCVKCGVRIRHGHTPSRGIYVLRGGTLDNQTWARPAAHIWLSEAVDWFIPPDGDLRYDVQPIDYEPITSLYRERIESHTLQKH